MCKYHRVKCVAPLHVTRNGQTVNFCLVHYRLYNAARRRRAGIQPSVTDDKRLENNMKRVKAHATDWNQIYLINDPVEKRIAHALLTFRDKRGLKDYILIDNVIDTTKLSRLRFKGSAEVISFDPEAPTKTRSQRDIINAQSLFGTILNAFKIVFPGCNEVHVKLLESSAGDKEQLLHTDFNYNSIKERVRSLKDFHYSALVAIEEGSFLIVGEDREKVNIPKNGMLFWRGSCAHAGGSYDTRNRRIFFSLSSLFCPVDKAVYIVQQK